MNPARVITAGVLWRLFGARQSAETLLQAVSGDDEQNRMLAGISLVKAGQRSFDLIKDKIEEGEASASAISLLPDIDPDEARPVLNRLADDAEFADTAQECIDTINRMEAIRDSDGR